MLRLLSSPAVVAVVVITEVEVPTVVAGSVGGTAAIAAGGVVMPSRAFLVAGRPIHLAFVITLSSRLSLFVAAFHSSSLTYLPRPPLLFAVQLLWSKGAL